MIGWYWILGFLDLSFGGDEGLFQMAPIEDSFIFLSDWLTYQNAYKTF